MSTVRQQLIANLQAQQASINAQVALLRSAPVTNDETTIAAIQVAIGNNQNPLFINILNLMNNYIMQ